MSKNFLISFCLFALLFLPAFTLAEQGVTIPPPPFGSGFNVWQIVINILKFVWPVFVGVAILMFLAAGFFFLSSQGTPEKTKLAKDFLIWAIVGFIVGLLAFSAPYIIINLLN